MGANRPITDEDRTAVRRLHAAGKKRNEIARTIGRSAAAVSKIAVELGLDFDRTATAAATRARSADLAERRIAFADKLHDTAEKLHGQLFTPHKYFDWGGKDHDFDTYEAPEPTPADKRALMGAISVAVDKSLKLVPQKEDHGTDEAVSMLAALAAGIRRVAAASTEEDDGEA